LGKLISDRFIRLLNIEFHISTLVSAPFYPNGDINFSCPCKSFIVAGPCGYEFRQWALCNHRERLAEEGHKSDDVTTTTTPVDTHKCDRALFEMFQCFEQYPKLFPLDGEKWLLFMIGII
jgi:hypothetical protein